MMVRLLPETVNFPANTAGEDRSRETMAGLKAAHMGLNVDAILPTLPKNNAYHGP
ncbi:MAG: hypothetical protein ACLQO6_14845 [Desulfomonilaceae bacterium]